MFLGRVVHRTFQLGNVRFRVPPVVTCQDDIFCQRYNFITNIMGPYLVPRQDFILVEVVVVVVVDIVITTVSATMLVLLVLLLLRLLLVLGLVLVLLLLF